MNEKLEDEIELYNARIAYVKSVNIKKDIYVNYDNDREVKQITGIKYKNYMYDIDSDECYQILVNEDLTTLDIGTYYKNINRKDKYVVVYNKSDISKYNLIKQLYYFERYNIITSKFKNFDRFYFATIKYVNNIKIVNGDKDIVNTTNKGFTVGIIRDNKFIDLKDYRSYNIAQALINRSGDVLVDEDSIYATELNELDDSQITDRIITLAKNYTKPKTNIIQFAKRKR